MTNFRPVPLVEHAVFDGGHVLRVVNPAAPAAAVDGQPGALPVHTKRCQLGSSAMPVHVASVCVAT